MDVFNSIVGNMPRMEAGLFYEPTGHENPFNSSQLNNYKHRYLPGQPREERPIDGPGRVEASVESPILQGFFKKLSRDAPYFSPREVANVTDFAKLTATIQQPVSLSLQILDHNLPSNITMCTIFGT